MDAGRMDERKRLRSKLTPNATEHPSKPHLASKLLSLSSTRPPILEASNFPSANVSLGRGVRGRGSSKAPSSLPRAAELSRSRRGPKKKKEDRPSGSLRRVLQIDIAMIMQKRRDGRNDVGHDAE